MSLERFAIAAAAALVVGGCDGMGSNADPTPEDFLMSIRSMQPAVPILTAEISQCRSGSGVDQGGADREMRVCDVCVIGLDIEMVGGQFAGGGTRLFAGRSYASVGFHQAISYDQPNVRPMDGEKGVWVIDPASTRERGPSETRQFSAELEQRAGFQSRTGFAAGWGILQVPREILSHVQNDDQLIKEVTDLVGSCEDNRRSSEGS